jgi:hypothetical protein
MLWVVSSGLDCPCTIYLYESHLYGYLPTRMSRKHSNWSVLYISVPATCKSTYNKHRSDFCRLVRVRHTRTSLLFCAFAVPKSSTCTQKQIWKKFIYVCLFVISCMVLEKAWTTNHHSADNLPYQYLRFRKKHLRIVIARKRAVTCVAVICHDRWPQGAIDQFQTFVGNTLLIKYFINRANNSTMLGVFSCFFT